MEVVIAAEGATPLRVRLDGRSQKEISLGAASTCELVLTGRDIADQHAQIVVERGGAWLCALEPLLLDGQQVSGWSALEGEASLEIGTARVRVSAKRGEAAGQDQPLAASSEWVRDAGSGSYAKLASVFALPPEELEATPSTPAIPFFRQRFLNLSAGVWILGSACVVLALVGFTTRSLPLARASRTPEVRPAAGPPVAPLAAAALPPGRGRRASPAEIRAAAEALFARDDARALGLYQELAARDERFRPFARALELRRQKR